MPEPGDASANLSPSPSDDIDRSQKLTHWYVSEREGEDGSKDIYFQVANPGSPAEQQSLKNEVERTLSSLRLIYHSTDDQPRFNETFSKLLHLSQLGLAGPRPDTSVAVAALRSLQAEIVDREAGRIKNGYMLKLGWRAALIGGLSTLLYFLVDANPNIPPAEIYNYRHVFLVWAGCMGGYLGFFCK